MSQQVDIVVPVYNDPDNFLTLYHTVCERVQSSWRLLIVYDMSEDTTLSAARPIAEKDQRIQLVRNISKGVFSAIKTGFAHAQAPATLLLMVDDPPEVVQRIDDMLVQMQTKNAAVVAASRYMKGGSHVGGNPLKGFLSRVAGLSLHYVIGLPTHDATYATKLFRTSFLHATPIESTRGFTYALELTLKAYLAGERITEVPVAWTERTVGTSRFAFFGWLSSYLYWYFWGVFHYVFSKK